MSFKFQISDYKISLNRFCKEPKTYKWLHYCGQLREIDGE